MGNYLAGFGENSGLLVKTVLHPVKNNYCLTLSIFLSIELQSYGLYLLSTIYRNSELATTGGLIYFLLGGSCFILLGTSLLYANSGTTNMDDLYIITSISDNINY